MKTSLLKGIKKGDESSIKQEYLACPLFRKQLIQVLNDKLKENQVATRSKDKYGVANWAYLQADSIGYERAISEIINLLA